MAGEQVELRVTAALRVAKLSAGRGRHRHLKSKTGGHAEAALSAADRLARAGEGAVYTKARGVSLARGHTALSARLKATSVSSGAGVSAQGRELGVVKAGGACLTARLSAREAGARRGKARLVLRTQLATRAGHHAHLKVTLVTLAGGELLTEGHTGAPCARVTLTSADRVAARAAVHT